MTTRTHISIAMTCLTLVIAGCPGPQRRTPGVVIGEDTVTIEQLALRLGLRIEQRDETFVVMKNAANTVIVFTHTDGRFFVNGKPQGSVGSVTKDHGVIRVSSTLAEQIRPHLRTGLPQPPTTPTRKSAVIIDAGHGAHDPGAISPAGIKEKDINLRVAAKVANLLEQRNLPVVMTRWQDIFIELEERAEIGNRRQAALFVSIHSDSAPSSSAQGFTIYVAAGASAESYRAAHAINQAMEKTGMNNRGVREEDFRVLMKSKGPAVLIELGYLSNPQDAARLADDRFRDRLAKAIADGIQAYLK
ncbi:MAG TPA: N-acetylmuramoyl-L-alanine amidase [Sedimentisphaerales bacterium]|nr:N-acetylmuramoyl-L-alanine amidase [Sedimentisphaerales bacterium]